MYRDVQTIVKQLKMDTYVQEETGLLLIPVLKYVEMDTLRLVKPVMTITLPVEMDVDLLVRKSMDLHAQIQMVLT